MKKWVIIGIIAILLGIIGNACSNRTAKDELFSSFNWGPDHYYDSNSHQVEQKAW